MSHIASEEDAFEEPTVERVQFELLKRQVVVTRKERLGSSMIRLTVHGTDLEGFQSASPDDHIKLFIPDEAGDFTISRDYTPRYFDPGKNELTLDFVAHPGGAAAEWALAAEPGSPLEFGGPRGSQVIHHPQGRWLLIGDESAIPAISRRIEEKSDHETITAIVLMQTDADRVAVGSTGQNWREGAANVVSLLRPISDAQNGDLVIQYLRDYPPQANTFIWIAGESSMVRAVRGYVKDQLNWPKAYLKVSGYWRQDVSIN